MATSVEAKIVAGGMTLLPTMKMRLAQPSDIVDLSGIDGLADIRSLDHAVQIGAMVRHADVAESEVVKEEIPSLARLAALIGDPQVRNRGTLGGSIANSDPAADYPSAILGLNATIRTNQRDIAADDFFLEMFETALNENEIIVSVSFPIPAKAAYAKFPNPASRYAVVGVFIAVFDSVVRVAVTGAGPCVFRENRIEEALTHSFSSEAVDSVSIDSHGLNADLHASADYRAHLISVMAKSAIETLAQ